MAHNSDTHNTFTLHTFIEHRWAEAAEVLARLDPNFVAAIRASVSPQQMESQLPPTSQTPSKRLNDKWHELLETTVDMAKELERINFASNNVATAKDRKTGTYFFETWLQHSYGLCEKCKILITRSCRIHNVVQVKERKFIKLIETGVQNNLSTKRHAIVHGVDSPKSGGRGIDAKGITEDGLWEALVILGSAFIPDILDSSNNQQLPSLYVKVVSTGNERIMSCISETLEKVEQEINLLKSK